MHPNSPVALRPRRIFPLLLALLALAMFAAACSSDDDDASNEPPADTDSGDPAADTASGASVPQAIVSLSPSSTEMLFAIGAGDQVVAVDSFSNFPPEAPLVEDLSALTPNVEAIAEFSPDLVVLSGDSNDIVAGLEAIGVQTLIQPAAATIEDTYSQITTLGAVTGHEDEAEEVVDGMKAAIAELAASVAARDQPLTYYHELDDTLFSVTSSTFIGEVYAIAGLVNVADAADPDGESFGFPQLSAEFLVEADPDLIFLADTKCCGQNLQTVSERPGFADLTAVEQGNVIELDDDIASRWGPRIVDFLRVIVDATSAVEEKAAA